MRTAYGFDDIQQNESLIHIAEKFILELTETLIPGRYLVNYFPILRYVPSWLPGAGFKKHFRSMGEMSYQTLHTPFQEAMHDAVSVREPFLTRVSHSVIPVGKRKERSTTEFGA